MKRHLKNRHNEGYVLLYVLIVIVVVCVVSMNVCTVSVRNLQAQQQTTAQMQQLYLAEGRIEQYAAKLPDMVFASANELVPLNNDGLKVQSAPITGSQCMLDVISTANEIQVHARLELGLSTVSEAEEPDSDEPDNEDASPQYSIISIKYVCYEITTVEGVASE